MTTLKRIEGGWLVGVPVVLANGESFIAPAVVAVNSSGVPVPAGVSDGVLKKVAASQTGAALGAAGAIGDFVSHVVIVPATTAPGTVALLDGATSYTLFTGGTSSVSNLASITIPINAASIAGAWTITTGANVAVVVSGRFTEA